MRNPWTAGILAGLLLIFLGAAPAPSSWPLFRADALQTGRAAGDLPADPKPLWTFKTQQGIVSTAAIVDGAV
ncbi:MAG TPA: hypothetical protein VLE27_10440, partial [Thermoanaerobaculia bacterium]|nr:hypothetical protein [Thermoanaerobaculia bacterium]